MVDRYRQKARRHKTLLPILPSWSPTGVLLFRVVQADRMRPSSVHKQRKALFFDQRNERCELGLQSMRSPDRLWAGLLYRASSAGRGGQSSCRVGAALLLGLQIAVRGSVSLRTARPLAS